jgi:hypothetical protein
VVFVAPMVAGNVVHIQIVQKVPKQIANASRMVVEHLVLILIVVKQPNQEVYVKPMVEVHVANIQIVQKVPNQEVSVVDMAVESNVKLTDVKNGFKKMAIVLNMVKNTLHNKKKKKK